MNVGGTLLNNNELIAPYLGSIGDSVLCVYRIFDHPHFYPTATKLTETLVLPS